MRREWKPGDVAMVNDSTGADDWQLGICSGGGETGRARWRIPRGEVWSSVTDVRPLVVIDPEDREQVARLAWAFWDARPDDDGEADIAYMRHALREIASPTPPEVDEPTAIGSQVETATGIRYTRFSDSEACSNGDWINQDAVIVQWSDISAVRVLSPGVDQ